jgi:predicted RNase H-like HicB family nuclease
MKISYTLYREDSDYVAQCLNFDVSSFGSSPEDALLNLKEAIELYLEDQPKGQQPLVISELTVGELAIA